MAWTYSGDPTTSQRDELRYILGDVDEANQLLQDAELDYELSKTSSALKAAVQCCIVLANRFARKAKTKNIGPLKIEYSELSNTYDKRATELRKEISLNVLPPKIQEMGLTEDNLFEISPPRHLD